MKTVVPPIVFTHDPTDNAEECWERMYNRIFSIALQRLENELISEENSKSYPQLS